MRHDPSGSLTADRRYRYAEMLAREGDWPAAADLFRQTIDVAPQWAPAWFGLGEALEQIGDRPAAVTAYRRALALAPEDAMGAGVRLARLGAGHPGAPMSKVYVRSLFDEYADKFDEHLRDNLSYRGPEIVLEALEAVRPGADSFGEAMDLGCGTGLMAAVIRSRVTAIDGVDLSPAMVVKARRLGLYRELTEGEMAQALAGRRYDLLLAADVLVYVGDLAPLFAAAAEAMRPGALFAFTVESQEGEGFALGQHLRFRHAPSYIGAMAAEARLDILHLAECATRTNGGKPVPGLVAVLARPDD